MTSSTTAPVSISDHASLAARGARVFDIDGTVFDTLAGVTRSLNAALADEGLAAVEPGWVRDRISLGFGGLVRSALMRDAGRRLEPLRLSLARERFDRHYVGEGIEYAQPYDGALAMLEHCRSRGDRLAVCSNGSGAPLGRLLDKFGLAGHFEVVVHGDNTPEPKPSALPLLRVLSKLQASPGRALMIGDSQIDAECARRAGVGFVWCAWGYGDEAAGADALARADDPAALAGLLAR